LTDKFYGTITTGAARKELTLNDAALTSGRVPFVTTNGRLTDDADMTFATDTLTVAKIVGSTSITDSGLTSGRVTFASTGGLLADSSNLTYNSGTGALTVAAGAAQNLMGTGLHINTAAGSTAVYDTQIEGDTDANLVYVDASADSVGVGVATPNSKLQVSGSLSLGYVAKTANYTLDATNYTVECTANSFTITLPTAVGITGRIYNIKNTGNGTITINTTSSQTIDGQTSGAITLAQYENLTVQSNNANWIIL
jgi:hypothetical protein